MNTPAHAIVNLALLGRRRASRLQAAVLAGAVLPDLPMIVFYLHEKIVVGTSETAIWGQIYWQQGWQDLFDTFHSLPLVALGMLAAWRMRARTWFFLLASMALHSLGDLPLHHDDAHRHFFPFSNWRFASPISYWDPRHHGRIMAPVEFLGVLACCVILLRTDGPRTGKIAAGLVGSVYLLPIVYFLVVTLSR
ncbi:MAG: hypothetical protein ACE5IK_06765 [Acidobacteriota bacterium]